MHDGKKPFFTDNCNIRHKKPVGDIEILINHLTAKSNKLETKDGQLLNYTAGSERNCFLLHKGTVFLYRKIDGMVLNSESAPYVFGLSTQLTEPDYLYIRIHEASEVSYLPIEEANKIIEREKLWKNLAHLLIFTATRVYDHCAKISALSSYEIICYQLYELMYEPEEIRNNISTVAYVMNRTFLSRSSIMKILAQLKTGGYITMEKGILKAINHIPSRY
ncbi:cyclic nucleotide-binding protein (plasmid) [Rahnella aquatilis]|nr:cyclic nucleotide-binding protein [Rahnella aquatilis]